MRNIPYSPEDRRVFYALKGFSAAKKKHNGLYLIKFDSDDPEEIRRYLDQITFKIPPKDDQFLPKYNGVPIDEVLYQDLDWHSITADGAIALDDVSRVFDDHRLVRELKPEMISPKAMTGGGHISMASASVYIGVTSYACSAERGTVTTFKGGQLVKDLYYEPDASESAHVNS
jgi:hypothetical protein